jgi:hypothetical protein
MFRFRFETEDSVSKVITRVIIVIEEIRKIGKARGERILDVADGDAMGVTLPRLRGEKAAPYQGQGFPQGCRSIGLCRIKKENTVIVRKIEQIRFEATVRTLKIQKMDEQLRVPN